MTAPATETHRCVLSIPGWRPALDNSLIYTHWSRARKHKRRDADMISCHAFAQHVPKATGRRRVVVCGHYTDNGSIEIHPHWQINRKHVELRGCWGSRYEHFARAVSIAARAGGRVPWREMAGRTESLATVAAALRAVEERSAVKALVSVSAP